MGDVMTVAEVAALATVGAGRARLSATVARLAASHETLRAERDANCQRNDQSQREWLAMRAERDAAVAALAEVMIPVEAFWSVMHDSTLLAPEVRDSARTAITRARAFLGRRSLPPPAVPAPGED